MAFAFSSSSSSIAPLFAFAANEFKDSNDLEDFEHVRILHLSDLFAKSDAKVQESQIALPAHVRVLPGQKHPAKLFPFPPPCVVIEPTAVVLDHFPDKESLVGDIFDVLVLVYKGQVAFDLKTNRFETECDLVTSWVNLYIFGPTSVLVEFQRRSGSVVSFVDFYHSALRELNRLNFPMLYHSSMEPYEAPLPLSLPLPPSWQEVQEMEAIKMSKAHLESVIHMARSSYHDTQKEGLRILLQVSDLAPLRETEHVLAFIERALLAGGDNKKLACNLLRRLGPLLQEPQHLEASPKLDGVLARIFTQREASLAYMLVKQDIESFVSGSPAQFYPLTLDAFDADKSSSSSSKTKN